MFITNNHAFFHSWWNKNLANYQKVSQYYENDYSLVISLFFHICFCFESLTVLFRVMNSEILTIFKMLLFNENCRFLYTCFKNFPSKTSADKMVIKNRKKVQDKVDIEIAEQHMKLLGVWRYRTDNKRKGNFTTSKLRASTFPLLMTLKSVIYVLRTAKYQVQQKVFFLQTNASIFIHCAKEEAKDDICIIEVVICYLV